MPKYTEDIRNDVVVNLKFIAFGQGNKTFTSDTFNFTFQQPLENTLKPAIHFDEYYQIVQNDSNKSKFKLMSIYHISHILHLSARDKH